MKYTYVSPWKNESDKEDFHTNIDPVNYKGFQIFFYYPGRADIVLNGHAVTQRACKTIASAKEAVDGLETESLYEGWTKRFHLIAINHGEEVMK